MKRMTRWLVTWLFAALVIVPMGRAQDAAKPAPFKSEELEQLVAPIALYPDALVAQVLMASTYPLEIVQAARWSKGNPGLKDKALQDALEKQGWDPSVKSLTAFPGTLAMMNDKLDWTQKLGDAFLAQQKEVLAAVQRLRAKAQAAGNLKSGKEQTVTTTTEGGTTVIKIEPANPEVVYIPAYNTTVVYGPWPYPAYPPYYWPPPYYGYPAGSAFFGFTVGIAIGAAWGNCNWNGGNVYINHHNYNNFNRTDIKTGDRGDWQHRPEHRKGVEYRDQGSRDKYSGQRPGVDTREAYRGRGEQGRQDVARADSLERDRGGGLDAGARDRAGGRQPDAFDGVGRGGEARDFSDRGAASRGNVSSGGARSGGGFHGGGGRGGGGRGGGGRR